MAKKARQVAPQAVVDAFACAQPGFPSTSQLALPAAPAAGVTAANLDAAALRAFARSLNALAAQVEGGLGSARRAALAVSGGNMERAHGLLSAARMAVSLQSLPMGHPEQALPLGAAGGGPVAEMSRAFLGQFEVDSRHVEWMETLGGGDLWNIAPRVKADGEWTNAARLHSTGRPAILLTTSGRVLAMSESITSLTLLDPRQASRNNAWRADSLGFSPAVHQLACELAGLSNNPLANAACAGSADAAASGTASRAAIDRCTHTLLKGATSLGERNGYTQELADAARDALAQAVAGRAAAQAAATGARWRGVGPRPPAPVEGPTSVRMTLFPLPAAVGVVVHTRASITVLRSAAPTATGAGGAMPTDSVVLHVALVPHCMAPLHPPPYPTPPLAARAQEMAEGHLAPSWLQDDVPLPSEGRMMHFVRSMWMGSLFYARHLPGIFQPATACCYIPTRAMASDMDDRPTALSAGEKTLSCDEDVGPVVGAMLFSVPLGTLAVEKERCRRAADIAVCAGIPVPKGLKTHWAGLPLPSGPAAERASLNFTIRKILCLISLPDTAAGAKPYTSPASVAASVSTASTASASAHDLPGSSRSSESSDSPRHAVDAATGVSQGYRSPPLGGARGKVPSASAAATIAAFTASASSFPPPPPPPPLPTRVSPPPVPGMIPDVPSVPGLRRDGGQTAGPGTVGSLTGPSGGKGGGWMPGTPLEEAVVPSLQTSGGHAWSMPAPMHHRTHHHHPVAASTPLEHAFDTGDWDLGVGVPGLDDLPPSSDAAPWGY